MEEKNTPNTTQVCVRVPAQTREKLNHIAHAFDLTQAQVIQALLDLEGIEAQLAKTIHARLQARSAHLRDLYATNPHPATNPTPGSTPPWPRH